jgi:eight-cysteine-cluster-containing protein
MKPFILVLGLLIFGCAAPQPPPNGSNNTTIPPGYENPEFCKVDQDCVRLNSCCDCALGQYVNKYNQKPECTEGPVCKCLTIPSTGKCESNKCVAVPVEEPPPANNTTGIPPGYEVKDYCKADTDCVRLNKCCDCGIGEYVNQYHQVEPLCTGPQCGCPIQLSHGECQDNKCTAVADDIEPQPPIEEKVSIFSGHGECGSPKNPESYNTESGLTFRGRVGAANPCRSASVIVKKIMTPDDHYYVLNVTTKPTDAEICVQCTGYVPWEINITGYWGRVDIYYGSQKVFPDKAGFCGWSTGGSCSTDADCWEGGCSGQVCQGKDEEPVITTCEWKDCYDNNKLGLDCGCIAGKCQWG